MLQLYPGVWSPQATLGPWYLYALRILLATENLHKMMSNASSSEMAMEETMCHLDVHLIRMNKEDTMPIPPTFHQCYPLYDDSDGQLLTD